VFTPFRNYCQANLKVAKPNLTALKPQNFQTFPELDKISYSMDPKQMHTFYESNK
jgi:hypothetical protein